MDPLGTGRCKHPEPSVATGIVHAGLNRCGRPIEEHERLVILAGNARQAYQFMRERGFPVAKHAVVLTDIAQLRGLERGRRVVVTGTWMSRQDAWRFREALVERQLEVVEEDLFPPEAVTA